MTLDPTRPLVHLRRILGLYPTATRLAAQFRGDRGKTLPDWPDWCYLPLHGAYAIVSGGHDLPPERAQHISELGALLAWRETQGVYVFDEDLAPSLDSTPLEHDLPTEALHHLPEWCVYVALDGSALEAPGLRGAFVHLDQHLANARLGEPSRVELRLLLDLDTPEGPGLLPIPIHLGRDLHDGIQSFLDESARQAEKFGIHGDHGSYEALEGLRRLAVPIVTRVLYLCAEESDVLDAERRPHPRIRAVSSRRPKAPLVWDVGARLGPALVAAIHAHDQARPDTPEGSHASPRPHVRRAHWHHFRVGPRSTEQRLTLRWLPPIPVNLDLGTIVPTIRRVQ